VAGADGDEAGRERGPVLFFGPGEGGGGRRVGGRKEGIREEKAAASAFWGLG
jgi:hypothetical protein